MPELLAEREQLAIGVIEECEEFFTDYVFGFDGAIFQAGLVLMHRLRDVQELYRDCQAVQAGADHA